MNILNYIIRIYTHKLMGNLTHNKLGVIKTIIRVYAICT